MHDDNKSNSGQIEQVVAMGGSEKTQDFFLWLKNIKQCQRKHPKKIEQSNFFLNKYQIILKKCLKNNIQHKKTIQEMLGSIKKNSKDIKKC